MEEKKNSLNVNTINNVKVKHEILKDISILDDAKEVSIKGTVIGMLMKATSNGKNITHGIEQSCSKNESSVFALFMLRNRMVVHEWIIKNYRISLKVENKEAYMTSVPRMSAEQNSYNELLKEFEYYKFTQDQIKLGGFSRHLGK